LNGYHWLIYAPLRTLRHDKQIAEVSPSQWKALTRGDAETSPVAIDADLATQAE
jgi:hypothetical protein